MLVVFMLLVVLFGVLFVYLEIKNRESSEKLFYTFYAIGMFTLIVAFLKFFNSLGVYIFFLLIYIFLLYSIYTNFEIFSIISEVFLSLKKVSKSDFTKVDMDFIKLLKDYYMGIIKDYKIAYYKGFVRVVDIVFLGIGIISIAILSYLFLKNNVF